MPPKRVCGDRIPLAKAKGYLGSTPMGWVFRHMRILNVVVLASRTFTLLLRNNESLSFSTRILRNKKIVKFTHLVPDRS